WWCSPATRPGCSQRVGRLVEGIAEQPGGRNAWHSAMADRKIVIEVELQLPWNPDDTAAPPRAEVGFQSFKVERDGSLGFGKMDGFGVAAIRMRHRDQQLSCNRADPSAI